MDDEKNPPPGALGACLDLTPTTMTQLIQCRLAMLLRDSMEEAAGLVRLTGKLTRLGEARNGRYYGVKVTEDGGGEAKVDLPATLVAHHKLEAGQVVRLTGTFRFELRYGMEVRLVVGAAEKLLATSEPRDQTGAAATSGCSVEFIKSLPWSRRQFPVKPQYTVAIIQSASAQAKVAQDCEGELQELVRAGILRMTPVKVNILDPLAIADAIRRSEADILMVIRGGGDIRDFEVFDDARVLKAMSDNPAYRVVGLGHSGDNTVLDLVADFAASTPTKAGNHVRSQILSTVGRGQEMETAIQGAVQRQTAEAQQTITSLKQELSDVQKQLSEEREGGVAWYNLVLLGVLIGGVVAAIGSRVIFGH